MPDEWFGRRFGKRGPGIRDRSRGIDDEPVQTSREAKSISSETTFPQDLSAVEDIRPVVERLSGSVAASLNRKGLTGRTVIVKMRLSDFTTFTRQTTLPESTNDDAAILTTAWALLEREMTPGRAFRLLGVGVSGFAEAAETDGEDTTPVGSGATATTVAFVARQVVPIQYSQSPPTGPPTTFRSCC